jgi:FKBP-type peptidyl-prolyl cis-trans isomerase
VRGHCCHCYTAAVAATATGRVIAAWDAIRWVFRARLIASHAGAGRVLATMLVGESCEMITSAGYAYGEAGAGDGLIPSGAALWFRIELLGARIPQDNPSGGRAAEARAALKEKAEKEAAQAAAREAAAAEAEEALAAEVVEALEALHVTPEPKQLKDTLMLMQTVASEEFLQAHKIADCGAEW